MNTLVILKFVINGHVMENATSIKCVHNKNHISAYHVNVFIIYYVDTSQQGIIKKGKRKVQGVSQSQTAALPLPQEEEETDKSKQAQTEQTYEKH